MSQDYQISPTGPSDARIVIVVDAPTAREVSSGHVLGDDVEYGRLLNKYLASVGLQRESIYVTSVVKSYSKGGYNKLSPELRFFWHRDFLDEINSLEAPKVIIPLEKGALEFLTGKFSIAHFRGSVLEPHDDINKPCVIIPTYHPSATEFQYKNWALINADLYKAKNLSERTEPYAFPQFNFVLKPSFDQTLEFFAFLEKQQGKMITMDIENPHMLLSCIGFAWSRYDAFCLPFYYGNGRNYWSFEEELHIWKELNRILPMLDLANQTVMYDWEIMYQHGITLKKPVYDSMLMHACLYSEMKHTLEIITSIYTDIAFYKKDEKEEKGSVLKAGKEMEHWRYNAFDCVAAYWAIEELKIELVDEDMYDVYINLFAEVVEPLMLMNRQGVRLNMDDIVECRADLSKVIKELDTAVEKAAGKPVNVKSSKQVADMLYDTFQMQIPKVRAKSARPTNEEAMKKLKYKYKLDIFDQIVEDRKHSKLLSLFSDDNIDADGRVRCQYSMSRTSTGRLNSRKKKGGLGGKGMNLQNVKTSGPARAFFIAERGEVLLGADQKQAEARIVAALARDDAMKALFDSDVSIHIQSAKNVFGKDIDKHDPLYRVAKSLIHAGNYGIGPWGFAYASGLIFREAKEKLAMYYATYPGIKMNFHQFVIDSIDNESMLHNPFGRREVFLGRKDENTYRAGFSFIPQSTITDINKTALKKIYKANLPLLETHDGLILSVRPNEVEEGRQLLEDAYDIEFELCGETMNIPIDITVGDNWRDMEELT